MYKASLIIFLFVNDTLVSSFVSVYKILYGAKAGGPTEEYFLQKNITDMIVKLKKLLYLNKIEILLPITKQKIKKPRTYNAQ